MIYERGYNLSTFATAYGTTKQNIGKIIQSPSYQSIERIAEVLEVPIWQLFVSPDSDEMRSMSSSTCPHCGGKIHIRIDAIED